MKILAISHIFPPAVDGGSKVIYQLSHQLENEGHQVIYLSSDCSSTDDFVKKYSPSFHQGRGPGGGFRLPVYHHLRRPLKFINLFIPKNSYLHQLLQVFQKGPIFKIIPFIKATIKIIKFKPDLIIAGPLPTTIILYANFFKKIINIFNFPLSSKGDTGLTGGGFCRLLINSSFHQSDPDFSRLPLIKTLQQADFLWTLTKYETDFFIKKLNINPKKIILTGNGVEEVFLKNNKLVPRLVKEGVRGRLTILFIGSLASHKRVDLLIKSFANIPILSSKEGLGVDLVIVGQKTLFYPEIHKLYLSLPKSTQKQIHFKFNVSNKDLIKIIDQCQFLVLPSIQESFGLVLVEAWARSKAVITSNIPPLKEIVTSSNGGLVFKIDDINDLQQKIEKLISNPKLCHQIGQNGHIYVKNNYTWAKVSQKICQKILLSV